MTDNQTPKSPKVKTSIVDEDAARLSSSPVAEDSSEWASTTLEALGPVVETQYPPDSLPLIGETEVFGAVEKNPTVTLAEFQPSSKPEVLKSVEEQPTLAEFAASNEPEAFKSVEKSPDYAEFGASYGQPKTSTVATTPGLHIPGSYPGMSSKNTESSTIAEDAQHIRDMLTETLDHDAHYVKEATANALEKARNYASRTGEAVSGYLPPGMAAYLSRSPETSQHSDVTAPIMEDAVGSKLDGTIDAHSKHITPEPHSITASELSEPATADTDEPAEPFTGVVANHDTVNEQAMNSKPSFVQVDPLIAQNSLSTVQKPDEPTQLEPMLEGLSRITEKSEETHQSPAAPRELEPHAQFDEVALKKAGVLTDSDSHDHYATLASADASTRSLVGTQVYIGTPGASLFTGKDSTNSPSEPNGDTDNSKESSGYSESDAVRDEYGAAHNETKESKSEASGLAADVARNHDTLATTTEEQPKDNEQPKAGPNKHAVAGAPLVESDNHDTAAHEPSRNLAMAHDLPVVDGREYTTAAKDKTGEGVPYHMQTAAADTNTKTDARSVTSPGTSAHRFNAESGVIDSTHATPGHGAPIPPPKALDAPHKESAADGVDAGKGVHTETPATNGAASNKPPVSKENGAVPAAGAPTGMKEVKDAARSELKPTPGSAQKKHGFFHKLKRALGGRHGHDAENAENAK